MPVEIHISEVRDISIRRAAINALQLDMGTFHHVSDKHLDRYVDEFVFRFNNRKVEDGERMVKAIKKVAGKRLIYKEL